MAIQAAAAPTDALHDLKSLWPVVQTLTVEDRTGAVVAESFISLFLQGVSDSNINRRITRASHGVTDFTFICRKDIGIPSGGQPISAKFILKLMFPSYAVNTRLCSKALETLGMKTPSIFIYPKGSPCHSQLAGTIKKVSSVQEQNYSAAFMTAFPGADLGHLIETGALFQLGASDWKNVLVMIGKLAVFDLILGIDDRFYRPSTSLKPEQADPFCNPGNLMLNLPVNTSTTRRLEGLYCIDNVSSSQLKPTWKGDFPPKSEKYLKKFYEAFCTFYPGEKRAVFAEIIFDGIFIPILEAMQKQGTEKEPKELFSSKGFAIDALVDGISQGYEQLKRTNPCDFNKILINHIEDLNPDTSGKLFCTKIINLVELCFNFLNK